MKIMRLTGAGALAIVLATSMAVTTTPAFAGANKQIGKPVAQNQARYLIQYNANNKAALIAAINAQGGSVAYDYSALFNGIAADLPDNAVRSLRVSGLITTIEADEMRMLHQTRGRSEADSDARAEAISARLSGKAEAQSVTSSTRASVSKSSSASVSANGGGSSSSSTSSSSTNKTESEGSTAFEDGGIPDIAPAALPAGFPGPLAFSEFVGWDRDRAQADAVWSVAPNYGAADNGIAGPDVAPGTITGAGVVVGVLDTGIDYDHPDLVANIMNDCGTDGVTRDFLDGDDCPMDDTFNGHGTSVASVIASADNGIGLIGVAPNAKIRPYRVCDGGCPLSAIIGGIVQATEDGVDVINMSFGGGAGKNFEASALQAANQRGIVLVASAGNGSSQKVHFPAGYDTVIAVGATDINDNPASFTNYGGWVDLTGPGVANPTATCTGCVTEGFVDEISPTAVSFAANEMTNSPTAIVSGVEIEDAGIACGALPAGSLTGKAAFIRRGSCTFATKVANAEAAGAVGSVVANNAPGNFFGTLGAFFASGPSVTISQADGDALLNDIVNNGPVTVDLGIRRRNDIEYWLISGTSFSGPTVAGVAALVLEANPNLSPIEVRKILEMTADPIGPQVIVGAGMVNAEAAVAAAMP